MKMCPALFHTVYPYAFTMNNGGWFSWVKPDDGVIVQCPEGVTRVKIFKREIKVIEVKGKCQRHEPGDLFLLEEFVPVRRAQI